MEKILVIGGTGFIGQNVINLLKERGYYVGNYSLHDSSISDESYSGDVYNDSRFESIVSNYDKIIYLITTVSPTRSMDKPTEPYMYDIPMLIKTLESCRLSGIKRVVFASSGGTIYGDNGYTKSKETDFNEPRNHYAICKLTSEKILEMYNKLYGMENISLRISNPYGFGQRVESQVGAITIFTKKLLDGEKISIFGNGDITRDYVSVKEVAEAFLQALSVDFSKIDIPPVFNIGSGEGISLKELIDIISNALEIEPVIEYLPEREFDVKYNVLDISNAKKYLGYNPNADEKEEIKHYVKSKKIVNNK